MEVRVMEVSWCKCFHFLSMHSTLKLKQLHQFIQFTQQPLGGRLESRRMETKRRTCDLCGFSTSKASSFKSHKKIHTGEKPYQCTSCDYSCTKAGNLKTHSYTHTGEKPYQCGSCNFSTTESGKLKKHSYTHTGEKLYQCSNCDYSCITASKLKRHMKIHKEKNLTTQSSS